MYLDSKEIPLKTDNGIAIRVKAKMTTVTTFHEAKICVCIGIFRFTLLKSNGTAYRPARVVQEWQGVGAYSYDQR